MFVTLLVTLLFSVRGSNADSGASEWGETSCHGNFCIILNKGEITAETGLCAVIPCSFTPGPAFTTTDLTWMKCEPSKERCAVSDRKFHTKESETVQSQFKGRVSLLQPNVSLRNCSIIINDLIKSDSGSYQLRIIEYTPQKADGFTFSQKANVSVKSLSQRPTVMVPPLTAGQQATLTCIAPGLCSGSEPKITWMWRGAGGKHITGNITDFKTESLTNVTQRHSSTLTFNASAEHHDTKVTCKVSFRNDVRTEETVTLNVTYMKKPVISGKTSVEKGHALNLTCSVKSFPPSRITWTKLGSNTNLHSEPDTNMSNNSDSATLVIQNVTRDDSGRFICTAEHLDKNVTIFADITVTWFPKIVQTSECNVQLNVLTCVCITEGFPLPTIKWPLLKNHTQYSVMTTVSNHTVNSTITLTVKDHSNTTVECVSTNENGEATEKLIIQRDTSDEKDKFREVLSVVSRLEVVLAFLTGALLSTVICCFIRYCHRKKQNSFENLDETMEMIDGGQAVGEYQTYYQETAEEEGRPGAEEKAALKLNSGLEDLHYASIDFSLLKRKSPREEATMPEKTETEYAEIKREVKEKEEDNSRDKGEMLVVQDEETKHGVSGEEKEEDMAVYSNVKDVMSEI